MAQPTTNHPLEVYACTFEDVKHFKQKHALAATIALFACTLIAVIGYYLLTNNTMDINFGHNLNITASVVTGSTLLSMAIIGILIHYGCNISAKEAAASEEHFLKALTHPRTIALLSAVKQNKQEWAWERFGAMLKLNFPEENWQGMMRYFDDKFYHQTGFNYAQTTIDQVFDIFLYADPQRFILNFIELKVQNSLHPSCIHYLANKLQNVYRNWTGEEWAELIKACDEKYDVTSNSTDAKIKQQLLADLNDADPNKKLKNGALLIHTIEPDTATDTLPFSPNLGGTKGKNEEERVEANDDLLISD